MPLMYHEGNPQDAYAIQRLGSTFSDAVINMQRNRMAQSQFQQEMALRAQQMMQERDRMAQERDMANQRLAVESKNVNSQILQRDATTNKLKVDTQQMQDQGQAGGMLGDVMKGLYETNPEKNPDVTQFLRGIAAQQESRIAATNPSNIAEQTAQIEASRDPQNARLIATRTPAIGQVAPGSAVVDFGTGRKLFENNPRVALRDPEQIKNDQLQTLMSAYNAMQKDYTDHADPVYTNVQNQILSRLGVGQAGGGRVKVRSKDGKVGTIPAEQLNDAMAEGYSQVQ